MPGHATPPKRSTFDGHTLRLARMGRDAPEGSAPRPMAKAIFTRNLAMLAREMVPPELLIEFHLAVLQGHDPHLVRDDDRGAGWRVAWSDKGELKPSLNDKVNSVNFLRQAGWGLPAQSHYIEADIRQHSDDPGVDLSLLVERPELAFRLMSAIRGALTAGSSADEGSSTSEPGVIDAESGA